MSKYASAQQLSCFDRWSKAYWKAYWSLNHPYYANYKYNLVLSDVGGLIKDLHDIFTGSPGNRATDWAVEWLHEHGLLTWSVRKPTKELRVKLVNTPTITKTLEYVPSADFLPYSVWRAIEEHFELPYHSVKVQTSEPDGFDNAWERAMKLEEPPAVPTIAFSDSLKPEPQTEV